MSTNTVTPAAPAIMGLIDHSVSNYADFGYGATLNDDAPGIVFTTVPGDTYSLYDNGALIGTMVATRTNTNWTVPSVLFNGTHVLTLMATDAAGNNSAQSSINFTVAAGPAAPAYLGLIDHSISNYAEADITQITHDAHPSIVLNAAVGGTLNLFDNGQLIGTMVVTQSNTKWDLPTMTNGVHNLSITETNASGTSVPLFLHMTIDAPVAPATPAIMGLIDHSVSNYADFGYGATLNDDAPGIVFTTVPGDTYSLYDNGALIGTMVATSTNTNWTVPSVLFNGTHVLTLMATDAAGNNSAQSSINFTVAAGPAAPAYLGLIDHSISNYAEADITQITHDAHPSIVLNAAVGGTLNLFDNGQLIGTMVVTQSNTKWDLPTMTNGVHNLSITETNASGTSVPLFLHMTIDAPAAQSLVSAVAASSQDVAAVSNDASVGLHDTFVASASHQNVDLNVDPSLYFKQSTAHIEGGGAGIHALHLEGSHQVLDLTSLTGTTAAAKISGVQVFDLAGHGNTLNLSTVDVLNLGQPDLFQHDGNKQVMVNGSASDTVDLLHSKLAGVADASWVEHGAVSVGGVTYNVYQDAGAHVDLLVQQGVNTVVH